MPPRASNGSGDLHEEESAGEPRSAAAPACMGDPRRRIRPPGDVGETPGPERDAPGAGRGSTPRITVSRLAALLLTGTGVEKGRLPKERGVSRGVSTLRSTQYLESSVRRNILDFRRACGPATCFTCSWRRPARLSVGRAGNGDQGLRCTPTRPASRQYLRLPCLRLEAAATTKEDDTVLKIPHCRRIGTLSR